MKIKRLGFLLTSLVLVSILFLSNSCKHDGIPASEMAPVSFTEVLPVFQNYCGTCHSGNGRDKGLDFTTYAGIRNEITPGNASKSKAYQAMTSTIQIMPPNIALPTNKRTLIRLWIDQGANPN